MTLMVKFHRRRWNVSAKCILGAFTDGPFPLPQTGPSRKAKPFAVIEDISAGKLDFEVAPKLHRPIFSRILEDHAAWEAQAGQSTVS